jgi:hypothetical protein
MMANQQEKEKTKFNRKKGAAAKQNARRRMISRIWRFAHFYIGLKEGENYRR